MSECYNSFTELCNASFTFTLQKQFSKKKMIKTNQELQEDVQNAIKWEPLLHAAEK